MTPHRFHSAPTALAIPPDPGAGVVAGLLAILGAFWNLHVVVLFLLVVLGGAVDLWTGSQRARANDRLGLPDGFDKMRLREGLASKASDLVIAIFYGLTIDGLVAVVGGWANLEITGVFQTYTPGMAVMLFGLVLSERESIKANRENTPGGKGKVPPIVETMFDVLRWKFLHPFQPFPASRWKDGKPEEEVERVEAALGVTPEEQLWLDEQLAARRGEAPATPNLEADR